METFSAGLPTLTAPRLVVVVLLVTAARLMAETASTPATVSIDVRSSVDQRWAGIHKGGAIKHGKLYGIAAITETPSEEKLVKPVNQARLIRQLRAELSLRGYVEISAGQKPDVILTVHYGRGFLRNPYTEGMMLADDGGPAPVATIIMPDQIFRQKDGDFELKLQSAQAEKLFLRITAWKFPAQPREKPAQLWQTTMLVDDPRHLDLNQVTGEMLAAGADYFDRQIDREEVQINRETKETRVIVNPLKVLETDVKVK
ncbi:MAG: DUF4136 domain-containing protein [Opitutae bacterium]